MTAGAPGTAGANYRARGGAMAEQETDAVRELLTELEEAREAATPGPWENPYPFTKLIDAPGDSTDMAIVQCDRAADAALIVAAVNALPALTAAVRAVLDLADTHAGCCGAVHVDRLRAAVAEALEVR